MTREMALRELEGRWSFELEGDRLLVRDPALVRAILEARAQGREQGVDVAAPVRTAPPS